MKSEIAIRDYKLNESSKEELNKIKKENEKCKATLQEMKVKLDNLNKNSKLLECGMDIDKMQNEYENQLLLKEEEKSEIKEENEKLNSTVEKMKKIEKVLRTQLTDKEAELENYKKFSEETREENEKILDVLKKRYDHITYITLRYDHNLRPYHIYDKSFYYVLRHGISK